MTKRTAATDINHDNWDDPIEVEEKGSFKMASRDTLKNRVIKTAKRKLKPSENSEDGKSSIFASLAFKTPALSSNNTDKSAKPFGFLSNVTATSTSSKTPTTNGVTLTAPTTTNESSPQQKYLANLKELNCSVSAWIKTHVDTNPVCILTPIFNDYEKHLKQIQTERDTAEKQSSSSVSSAPASLSTFSFVSSSTSANTTTKFPINIPTTSSTVISNKTFTFADTKTSSSEDKKISSPVFTSSSDTGKSPLLQSVGSSKPAAPSIFGSFNSGSTGSSLLSKPDPAALMINPFTSSIKPEAKPFSFSNGAPPVSNKEEEDEEESEEPPKVEFTPVKEDGAIYTSRCKVFVKKDNNYKERGVGSLFIKKVGEDKYQLLVRAETVLGNILVNVLLSGGMPTQRMGKNNVMLVCVPTPQDIPPPTTVLLRVKTEADADELLATINKYKK